MLVVLSFANVGPAMGATWTATGSLNVGRFEHTATLLNNGMVLMASGTSAELYNPATGIFTPTGSLNSFHFLPKATLLKNGMVLITGDFFGGTTAELYNPSTGMFTVTGNLNTARYRHTATLLNNGMVLIAGGATVGGANLSSAELYDPATGIFTPTGSLNTARWVHTATLLNNGMVLIAGGFGSSYLSSAELYNPGTGTFSTTGSLGTARYFHTATLLNNGMVLLAAGYGGDWITAAELYNPTTETFTPTGSLNTGRNAHTATLLSNGMVLIAGGQNIGGPLASAELYDPGFGTFTLTGSLNTGRWFHSATLLNNGAVLAAGGTQDGINAIASAELYGDVVVSLDTVGPVTSSVSISPDPVAVNTGSSLSATVSDATTGGSNVASAVYSVNGGTPSQMLLTPSTAVTTQASASLAPISQSNVYTVCVHGTDSAGNTGADACILLPVYDPTGSFVTGGGQVASPSGADLLNTSAAGAATFGFVSKYLPGMNVPSGNLEFQFKEGNLNFKSTNMDWLVVTGEPRAKFHGTGTVNGANVCNFEVDAWAGSFTGNVDAFGLKITACANGGDRYSLPATALTHGSIIIHK